MSRSLGVSSLASFPPIRKIPEVMSSSPATIRSAVVFPHPDGPTSTMNSPSAISTDRSFTAWKPFSYTLLILSRLTVATTTPSRALARDRWTCSSLYRARGQAGDHELSEDEDQDADWNDRDHTGREDGSVGDLEVTAELGDADRDGPVVVAAVERQRHQELGPAGGEAEDARGEQARQGLRQDDRPHGARRSRGVDPAGLLHLLRYAEEVVPQDPDGERQVERGVRQDQRLVTVQPAHLAHQQVQRREHGDGREHRDHQQRHQQAELAPHGQPAERVPGQGAQGDHQGGGDD